MAPEETLPPPGAAPAAETPPEPKALFFVISFFVPIAGVVLGAIYLSKAGAANREFGKNCLVWALVNFAIGISCALCVVAFYITFFAGYFAFLIGLIGLAGAGAFS